MIRSSLPVCRWRGRPTAPGLWECRSSEAQLAGSCATTRECLLCPVRDHEPRGQPGVPQPGAGSIRHLAYHCYPRGDEWRPNLRSLRQRMSLFQGRRLMTVALDPQTARLEDVADELEGLGVELIPAPNDPALREMVGYPRLMGALSAYRGAGDCHWYGHAKGISSAGWAPAVRDWRDAMYTAQLDYWPLIQRLLVEHAAVGQYLRPRHIIEGSPCRWHYSGSYSWRRHLPLYERRWDEYDQHWCGSESHLGRIYRSGEVMSLYGDRPPLGLDLYLEEVWAGGLRQLHRQWCESHVSDRRDPLLVTVLLTAARQPELVHDAIASVQAQATDEWELVVMDAGEQYDAGLYDRYAGDARVRVYRTNETAAIRKRLGVQAWAINEAWRRGLVRGDLVMVLSDDDVLSPTWLAHVLAAARAHPDQSAWHGSAERRERDDAGRERVLGQLRVEGVAGEGRPLRGVIDGMQVAVRRSAWRPWPEGRAQAREADGWWMDTVAGETPIHPLNVQVGVHRHTPLSTWTRPGGIQT